mmetsp:Transcript_18955/g.47360  ORF Transcript_18955/g.47360 Transcript_18955/m.47360 type:complete len:421 (+) Transcript_18955:105-1367(+)|eukprot:CAMPEP_0178988722 /NCGR_PEP_ID=MMETSP0795-20121207/3961_1 /TAXON_ID=88552 /ORGANISM="Amoebophrya sp., Strain Ameob2" /LENGTH=420 /DNA_ID=CAMNT_0020680013 /DNA_START=82 /DNA_END=1344 /DNA_ORIENTATION=+
MPPDSPSRKPPDGGAAQSSPDDSKVDLQELLQIRDQYKVLLANARATAEKQTKKTVKKTTLEELVEFAEAEWDPSQQVSSAGEAKSQSARGGSRRLWTKSSTEVVTTSAAPYYFYPAEQAADEDPPTCHTERSLSPESAFATLARTRVNLITSNTVLTGGAATGRHQMQQLKAAEQQNDPADHHQLMNSSFRVDAETGEVQVPPELRGKFNDACVELGVQSVCRLFLRKYFLLLRKRGRVRALLVEDAGVGGSANPALKGECVGGGASASCARPRVKEGKKKEALKEGIATLAAFFANRVSGISEAACLRDLAFSENNFRAKKRDFALVLPALLSLAQWRKGWLRGFLAHAFWRIKLHATVSKSAARALGGGAESEGGLTSVKARTNPLLPVGANLLSTSDFKASVSKDGAVSSFQFYKL